MTYRVVRENCGMPSEPMHQFSVLDESGAVVFETPYLTVAKRWIESQPST